MSETPYVPGGPIREVPIEETPFARGPVKAGMPTASAVNEAIAAVRPSRAWRIVRMTLGVLGILALIEAIVIMTLMFALVGAITSRINDATPSPVSTGCPFDDPADCGG